MKVNGVNQKIRLLTNASHFGYLLQDDMKVWQQSLTQRMLLMQKTSYFDLK